MRIFLDENLPRNPAAHLVGHECRTVVACGWSGKKNGDLLALADPQFDVLLTLDKNLPYRQNLDTNANCGPDRSRAVEPDSGSPSGRSRMPGCADDHSA